jgi:hypothetical protein
MFEQATVLGPQHCPTWQAYGMLLEKMNRPSDAAEKFDRALEIDSSSLPTFQAYGLMEARRGNYDKARELFQRGLAKDTSHAPIFHAWARMEEQLGNHDKARDLLNAGVASAPQSVALLKAWALMELRLGHIDSSNAWYVSQKMGSRKLSKVSERLEMLRLLIEQRSEDDLKLVMKWIEQQRNQKLQSEVDKTLTVGAALPKDWVEGRQYELRTGANYSYNIGDTVVVRTPGGVWPNDGLCFGRILAAPPASAQGAGESARVSEADDGSWGGGSFAGCGRVLVHIGTVKIDGPKGGGGGDSGESESMGTSTLKKFKVVRRGEGTRLSKSMVTAELDVDDVSILKSLHI